ncbi:MAG: hypothetical protein IT158_04110 [Bryobacterales bacterium]|nr:hypothetical protein [Bryobacterales bacterium]
MGWRAGFAAIVCSACSVCLADDWSRFQSPAFDLLTNAGEREGRTALVVFEQFRHALGRMLGIDELRTEPPIRILLFDRTPPAAPGLIAGPDRFSIVLEKNKAIPRELLRDLAVLYLETNSERLPAPLERGLVELFSTLEVDGTHITLGRPVPSEARTREWALMHMLAVDPEYYGKVRVLLANLRRGIDQEAAYRNAFAKPPAEIAKQAQAYFQAGSFTTAEVSGRPLSPRDFEKRPVEDAVVQQALAGLKGNGAKQAEKLIYGKAEEHLAAARKTDDPGLRIKELQAATEIGRRRAVYWQALAEEWLNQKNFSEAAKAWRAAEQAAVDDADRARIRQARASIEQQRLDFEEAEKRRAAEERERELKRLKEQALAEVRALEARANAGSRPAAPGEKVEPWWEGPRAQGKATGTLRQIDCIGKQARLVLEVEGGKTLRLLIRDPGQVALIGGGVQTLGCGPQKGRRVRVEYHPKPDSKTATAGEVATIEFL